MDVYRGVQRVPYDRGGFLPEPADHHRAVRELGTVGDSSLTADTGHVRAAVQRERLRAVGTPAGEDRGEDTFLFRCGSHGVTSGGPMVSQCALWHPPQVNAISCAGTGREWSHSTTIWVLKPQLQPISIPPP